MKNPEVSFVIRTKNEEKFIGLSLKLLMRQTFRDFEVIVVDSGSTDRTLQVVEKFTVKLIKIRAEDFGYSRALNLGISQAKGRFIGIISGHSIPVSDTWLEDGLKNFVDKNVAAVSGTYTEIPVGYFWRKLGLLFFNPFDSKKSHYSVRMTNSNCLIRKSVWEKYHFDESLAECEDYDWAQEALARGYDVVIEPRFNVFHSHMLLGRPGYWHNISRWKKVVAEIDKRKRPRGGI